jgi:prefoldin subunit 5
VGPDRKENLKSHDARERDRQELEMLLADSNRLVREMQLLAAQSAELARQHAELAKHHAELLITLKGLKQRPKR